MQFHYVVGYDTKTKKWFVDDETKYLDGNIWITDDDDFEDMDKNEWMWASTPEQELIDERCTTMLTTLASIWPEVDHGDY